MENEPGDFLQVPITERERVAARSRSSSNQPLLPTSSQSSDKDFEKDDGAGPSRFPSVHGGRQSPPSYRSVKPDGSSGGGGGGQYTPISPIDEEDIANAAPLRQRTIHQSETSYEPFGPLPDLWQPIWLKRIPLALFALLYVLLMVTLIVIWVFDQQRNGFYIEGAHGHEFWQYIPTILLVFLVALWRQVDYHCKALTPWDELQKGPVGPKKSLLLDYVSKFQVASLFQAFLRGHIPVIATVSTFILLKIVMVLSTGSFIILPTNVRQDGFPLVSTLRFDASSIDPDNLGSISSSPVYAYYGNAVLGMPYQSGTLSDRAYMPVTFNAVPKTRFPENVTLIGNVDSFAPSMDCHTILGTLEGPERVVQVEDSNAYGDGTISFTLPDGDVCRTWAPINISALNPQTTITPRRQVSGTLQAVYCAAGGEGQLDTSNGPAALLYTVTDFSYEQDLVEDAALLVGGSLNVASSSSRSLDEMINVICQPSFTIDQVRVSNDTTKDDTQTGGVTVETLPNSQNKTLGDLTDADMSLIFTAAVSAAEAMFGEVNNGDKVIQASNTIFSLMALSQGSQDISILLDADQLNAAAVTTYKGIMAQYARQSLTTRHDTFFTGTATFREPRYQVNEASFAAMIAAFAVGAACSIILIMVGPKQVVPRDPNSIAAAATVLSRSIEVNRLLRREGLPTLENQQAALEGYEFGTAIATTEGGQSSFKIVTSEGLPENIRQKPEKKLRWWHPVTASIPFAVVVIGIPLVLIILLEVFQRSSDRNNGILEVPDDLATDVFTHYIPALVLVLVSSLINLIDFNIELFTPWARLKQGNATHRRSLLSYYLGKSPPSAFIEAFRTRRYNVLASLTATTVASILAIVGAGLYNSIQSTSTNTGVSLNRIEDFELQWDNSRTQDKGAAGMINMILRDNLDYPAFTYRELVFPSFAIGDGLNFDNGSILTDTATAIIPAIRPNLRCNSVPASGIDLTTATFGEADFETDEALVSLTYALPSNCQLAGIYGTSGSLQFNLGVNLPRGGGNVFAGRMFDLLFGENASTYGNAGEFNGQYIGDNPPVGCPSLAFTYGEFQMNNPDVSKVSALICYQEIQQVTANVTLRSNTTTIDPTHPPTLVGNEFSLLSNPNGTKDIKTFDFRIQENLIRQLTSFSTNIDNEDFDNFFEAALNFNSSRPISPASLVGQENLDALQDTIDAFYRLYMAQAISMNMRQPISSDTTTPGDLLRRQSTPPPTSLATLITSNTTIRLIQNRGPKLTLQIMLGLISVLMAAGYLTTSFRRVLPCNPCSIAGTMSLLAGSDLCHSLDDGSCECCGKPRRNSFGTIAETIHADYDHDDGEGERPQGIPLGAEWLRMGLFEMVFAGKRYSMGWWREKPNLGKRRRYGVDIGGRADGTDDQEWELGPRASENSGVPFMGGEVTNRGRGDRDGRGLYYMPGHSREHSRGGSVAGDEERAQLERELAGEEGDLGRMRSPGERRRDDFGMEGEA